MTNPVILLVEDNPDDVILTEEAFSDAKLGNELHVVNDGVEALEYLGCTGAYSDRTPCDLPDLMLVDLNMPRMNGLELLRRVRADERTRHMPIVVLTSSDEERDIVESYELGANAYVRKPVAVEDFFQATRLLGMFWLVLNNSPRPESRTSGAAIEDHG